jgi:hypothetical protein
MTMQARMSADDRRLYNPSRDVAHNFKDVMELVAGRLEDKAWPELDALLARESITLDDLGEACGAYCRYLASAVDEPTLPMHQSLDKSGFFNCKPAAQIAVMAMIGSCYAGIQFAGIREATIGGEGPLQTVGELLKHAEHFQKYAGMSRLQRRWERFKQRCQKMLNAFYGK